jgi:hypothetical protein
MRGIFLVEIVDRVNSDAVSSETSEHRFITLMNDNGLEGMVVSFEALPLGLAVTQGFFPNTNQLFAVDADIWPKSVRYDVEARRGFSWLPVQSNGGIQLTL